MAEISKNQRIYLYSHSPEAEKAIELGEAAISSGGARRPNGTMLDMAKPLSFTLDDLKEMVGNDKQLLDTDQKVKQLSSRLGLSEQGMQELSKIGWLNNAAIGQVYSMTYVGFKQTLAGIEYISSHLMELSQYVRQRDLDDMKEKTDRFITYLDADAKKLDLPKFDVTSSNVDEHLSDIAAFIKRNYDGVINESGDGFLASSIIEALIVPFTTVATKYAIRFFYDNGTSAGGSDKWAELIYTIASDRRFKDKLRYYVYLETELPYKDKVRLGRERVRRIAALPNTVAFENEYALYHSKEEYLEKGKAIQHLLANPDEIPDDGKIYL